MSQHLLTEILPDFFKRYEWEFAQVQENLFSTGFIGEHFHCDIWLHVNHDWIFFAIKPYIKNDAGFSEVFIRRILELNYQMNLAKFSIDENKVLSLNVELPTENFEFSHFNDALTSLSHYADDHYLLLKELNSSTSIKKV